MADRPTQKRLRDYKISETDREMLKEVMLHEAPAQYLFEYDKYGTQFQRLRPVIKKIENNPVWQRLNDWTLKDRYELYEHYRKGEYRNSPEALLFSLYADVTRDNAVLSEEMTTKQIFDRFGMEYDEVTAEDVRRQLRGASINYPELVSYTDTLGLDYCTLKKVPEYAKGLTGRAAQPEDDLDKDIAALVGFIEAHNAPKTSANRKKELYDIIFSRIQILSENNKIEIRDNFIDGKILKLTVNGQVFDFEKGVETSMPDKLYEAWEYELIATKDYVDIARNHGYAFSYADLEVIGRLHQDNVHRKKIEKLLDDCNFHGESGYLRERKYEQYYDLIIRDHNPKLRVEQLEEEIKNLRSEYGLDKKERGGKEMPENNRERRLLENATDAAKRVNAEPTITNITMAIDAVTELKESDEFPYLTPELAGELLKICPLNEFIIESDYVYTQDDKVAFLKEHEGMMTNDEQLLFITNDTFFRDYYCLMVKNTLEKQLDQEKLKGVESTIDVLIKRPGELPEKATIPNTLRALQKAVDGYVEVVHISDTCLMICNENGKLSGLPDNFGISTGNLVKDRLVGTVIFMSVNVDTGDFLSLPEKETAALIKCFNKDKGFLDYVDFDKELGKMPENKIDALVEKCRSRVWREDLPEEWERGEFLSGAAAAYLNDHGLESEFDTEEKMVDLLGQVEKEYLHSEADCSLETNVEFAVQRCREREMEQQKKCYRVFADGLDGTRYYIADYFCLGLEDTNDPGVEEITDQKRHGYCHWDKSQAESDAKRWILNIYQKTGELLVPYLEEIFSIHENGENVVKISINTQEFQNTGVEKKDTDPFLQHKLLETLSADLRYERNHQELMETLAKQKHNSKEVNIVGEMVKDEKQYGNTVVNNTNSKEETKMAEATKEMAQQYVRKTKNVVEKDSVVSEGQSKYSAVYKGWIKDTVKQYEHTEKDGTKWCHSQVLVGNKEPNKEGKFPEKTYFELVEIDTKEKPDFSAYEKGARPVSFSGQICMVSQRDASGRAVSDRTSERMYARSAHAAIMENGKLVTDSKTVISSAENSLKNEAERAGREHVAGHFVNGRDNAFNKPIMNSNQELVGYRNTFSVIYTPTKDGKPVRGEDGKTVSDFMKVTFRTKEALTEEQIKDIQTAKKLSINFVEHVCSRLNEEKGEWKEYHVCEMTGCGVYLERDKTKERDPRPGKTYEGIVEGVTEDTFNTHAVGSNLVVTHEWDNLTAKQGNLVQEGALISIRYDDNGKVASLEEKEIEQEKAQELE